MIVVVIHWKIKPGIVAKFLKFWKTQAVVQDHSGLIGEILNDGHTPLRNSTGLRGLLQDAKESTGRS